MGGGVKTLVDKRCVIKASLTSSYSPSLLFVHPSVASIPSHGSKMGFPFPVPQVAVKGVLGSPSVSQ